MSFLTPQQALELAMDHHRKGRPADAERLYRQLHQLDPNNADIIHLLGVAASNQKRYDEARALMERSIALGPNVARYRNNYGTMLLDELREYEAAAACYKKALELDPTLAGAHYNLGLASFHLQRWDDSVAAYKKALSLDPNYPSCELNLGTTYAASGRFNDAIALYRDVLKRRPNDGPVATNLGNFLKEMGELDAAVDAYRHALSLNPNDAVTWNNFAVAMKDQGQLAESTAAFKRSLEIHPGNAEVRSNLILTLLFDPRCEPARLAEEERQWNRHHAEPLRPQRVPHTNDRSPERRLRVGYLSADLREHVVGRALLPVFERHDHSRIEPICYFTMRGDGITERYKAKSSFWRDVVSLRDEQLTAQIRADGIDILVDLGLHTSDNRLLVFARKPAPVQVSWLGYPGSSGMEAIDYRLTDPWLEPPGGEAAPSAEQAYRLPHTWSCYEPPDDSPVPNELPALRHGHVTFGSLNNFCKINDRVLEAWAKILGAVEGSHMVLLTKSGSHRTWMAEFLRQRGIAPERLEFLDYYSSSEGRTQGSYLRRYEGIDLALDTFPYNGMTTTFDALWMGVPVVSLIGQVSLGRAGLSLLNNIGLPEFAVASTDDYVRVAIEAARDLPRLAALRSTLRPRMQKSPLLDAESLAWQVEEAYRTMWRRWSDWM
jgi:predicted O-linked N-acetylglucosamine transferase (SPINDLY family)